MLYSLGITVIKDRVSLNDASKSVMREQSKKWMANAAEAGQEKCDVP